MYKKIFILIIINILLLLNNIYAQNSEKLEQKNPTPKIQGLYVAVYDLGRTPRNYENLSKLLVNSDPNATPLTIIYANQGSLVSSFDSEPWGNYPAMLSISPEFSEMKSRLRENFLVRWKGQIRIPKGYFAIKAQASGDGDKVFIYLHSDSNKENYEYLSKESVFLPKSFNIFSPFSSTDTRWEYSKSDQVVDIDIFFFQKDKHFKLNIEAVLGHTLDKIMSRIKTKTYYSPYAAVPYVKDGSKLKDITSSDIRETAKRDWKPFKDWKEYLSMPNILGEEGIVEKENTAQDVIDELYDSTVPKNKSFALTDSLEIIEDPVRIEQAFNSENTDSDSSDADQDSYDYDTASDEEYVSPVYEEEQRPQAGLKGEFVKIPHSEFPFEEMKNALISDLATDDGEYYASAVSSDWKKAYWEKRCPECPYHEMLPGIITLAEKKIKDQQFPHVGMYNVLYVRPSFDEREFDQNIYFTSGENFSLKIDTDNFPMMHSDLKLFSLFVKSFWYVEENEKSLLEAQAEESMRSLMKDSKSFSPSQLNLPQIEYYRERFKDFVGPGLFMTVTKLSGQFRLPYDRFIMSFKDITQSGACVFINRQKESFSSWEDLLENAFICDTENLSRNKDLEHIPIKKSNTYVGKQGDTINIEVYLFHYAGPMKMNIVMGPNIRDLKDLWFYKEYIVEE